MRTRLPITLAALLIVVLGADPAHAASGLVVKKSRHAVGETIDRLEAAVKERGLVVVARIDHSAAAQRAGLALRPTTLLIFGNPKVGTALMQSRQTIGIDLPLKALAWEDEAGQVWIAYNDPAELAGRHGVTDRAEVIARVNGVLGALVEHATQ